MAFRLRNKPVAQQAPVYAIVTSGFDDNELHDVHLHYTERQQPDLGGALNYSYDMLALPLTNIVGPYMAYAQGFRTTTPPTAFFQQAPTTGMGGTFTGQFVFQPLLDPNDGGTGMNTDEI